MAQDPASDRDRSPIRIIDSMGRWTGLLACAGALVAALLGGHAVLTAAFALLAAVALLVARVAEPQVPGPTRSVFDIVEEILAASDLRAIEAALTAEIGSWPEVELDWCVLTERLPSPDRVLPSRIDRALSRILASVADPGTTPTRVPLAGRGEAIGVPCGAASNLVLVVAADVLPEGIDTPLTSLAVLAGLGARQLRLGAALESRRSSARFEELVRFSSDAIFIVDAGGLVRYAAPSVTAVLGHPSVELVQMPLSHLVVAEQRADVGTFLGHVQLQHARQPTSVELRFERADGRVITGELTGANLLDNPDVRGMVVTVRDVSARIDLEMQLRYQAFHDGLTGLANRALFGDRLAHAMRVRREPGAPRPAVAYVDLDDFKAVNDSLGHAAGDQLLGEVAGRITACLRGADTAARLGGDEFAILLETVPGEEDLVELAQRVIDAVSEPYEIGGEIVHVSASAGVAIATDGVHDTDDLLRHADMAMYQAKVKGKGQVACYAADMHRIVHERLELTADLDRAIRDQRLDVHYQPIVELDTGRIVAVEAFVRWPHSVQGMLEPGRFLDLAEHTGLILPLGSLVTRRAVADVAAWRAQGLDLQLAINVSPRQFAHHAFEIELLGAVADHGLDPDCVVVEITERVLGDEIAERRVGALAEKGIRVAVDDFGIGSSSLAGLRHLPLHQLKIDRSFVAPLRHPGDGGIARTIVDLAGTLGIDAVAEGIEHADELDALLRIGCRFGQGNLFAAPAPADALLPLLVGGVVGPAPTEPA